MQTAKNVNDSKQNVVSAAQFQKYFQQIPADQRKKGFEVLSNYRCYKNGSLCKD